MRSSVDFGKLGNALWRLARSGAASELQAALDQAETQDLDLEQKTELSLLRAHVAIQHGSVSDQEYWTARALVEALSLGMPRLVARARASMADACMRQSRLVQACNELEHALQLPVPEDLRARHSLKLAYYLALGGRLTRSSALLDETESLNGRSLSVETRRLTNALFLGDPQAILSSIRRIQRLPAPAEEQIKFACLLARGVANLQLGRCELAAKNFRKAR